MRDIAGNAISRFGADVLLADPTIRALTIDSDGVPLRLGRKVRLATADQRHVLALRDRGCVFPGCDATPPWCDAHHQPAWTNGGHTDINSMFLLCRHHHVVTHRQGWTCTPDTNHPNGPTTWTWTTPTGRTIPTKPQHPNQPNQSQKRQPKPG